LRVSQVGERSIRLAGLAVAALCGAGLVATSVPVPGHTDDSPASADPSRPLTIGWAGGNADEWQLYQPERDPASLHYAEFGSVAVSVDRTAGLTDEVVTVTVTGMPGVTLALAAPNGTEYRLGANYVQAMQCWGDPADPAFNEHCVWGGLAYGGAGSATPSVPVQIGQSGSPLVRGSYEFDVPFRAVTGTEYSSLPVDAKGNAALTQAFRATDTNEVNALVDDDGTALFGFEVQSSAGQPYLGCGDLQFGEGAERCWLVIVPRGTTASGEAEGCFYPANPTGFGDPRLQFGSPIDPRCDYWDNRIVVPLDFRSTTSACAAGSAERRTNGTDLIAQAFASWQAELCQRSGIPYTFTAAADSVARSNLATGVADLVFTSLPLTPDTVAASDAAALEGSDIVYAPLTVTAPGIAFVANANGHIERELKLSPRLIAKWITGSYAYDQGFYLGGYTGMADLPAGPWTPRRCNTRLTADPEFRALNPGSFTAAADLVLVGPHATDAIAALWAYLQADDAARAFLSGEPDNVRPGDEANCGVTINPYYLPKGHPEARVPVLVEGTVLAPETGVPIPALVVGVTGGEVEWREVGLSHDDGTDRKSVV
jgi:hypothetical protein